MRTICMMSFPGLSSGARPARLARLVLGSAFALCVAASNMANAQPLRLAPTGPDLTASRDMEVRIDRLPDQLPADEIEVVVEASDEYCKPKSHKVLGLTLQVPVSANASFFCKTLESYVNDNPPGNPLLLSRQIWQERNIAAHVAQLDVPLNKRYLALTRWRAYGGAPPHDATMAIARGRWVVEELLWDREQGRLLWLALRSIYTDDIYEQGRVWALGLYLKRYYQYQLPAVLTRRGEVRSHAPVPGGRWVPAAEIPAWSSGERAALALVHTYAGAGDRWPGRERRFPTRGADQAPFVFQKFEWGQTSWFNHELAPEMAVSPRLDYLTHAVLEVPPGRYVIEPSAVGGTSKTVELAAGTMTVVNITRKLMGADEFDLEDLAWWSKWLQTRGRHAFLEDQRPVLAPVFVETWFHVPP